MAEDRRRSAEQWREALAPERYQVCILGATERAFTGQYNNSKDSGTYRCGCCGEALFESGTKFESGSGWPSFFQPVDPGAVTTRKDTSHGMMRVEVLCGSCDAHLGHLFPDGPPPSGQRYCMNSVALELDETGEDES